LFTNIAVDENGNYGVSSGMAWTGTNPDGTAAVFTCSNWTDGTAGSTGFDECINTIDSTWSGADWSKQVCNAPGNLYCFED